MEGAGERETSTRKALDLEIVAGTPRRHCDGGGIGIHLRNGVILCGGKGDQGRSGCSGVLLKNQAAIPAHPFDRHDSVLYAGSLMMLS